MKNFFDDDEETGLAQQDKDELIEIQQMQEEYETRVSQDREIPNPKEIQERLLRAKSKSNLGMDIFTVYSEPIDLYLIINDYLDTLKNKIHGYPTIPGLLSYIGMSKKKMSDILELDDAYAQILSMGLLKIESILLDMGLQKRIEPRTLNMVLKNYHGLQDKIEVTSTKKTEHNITIVLKPAIESGSIIDGRLIEVDNDEPS